MAFPQVGVEAAIVGLNKFNSGLAKMQGGVDKFAGAVDKAASPVKKLGSGLVDLGTKAAKIGAVGLVSVGVAAAGVATASVKAAIDFESAWAGVVKTTDGLEDEFGNLTETGARLQKGFRDLSKTVPITVEDLLQIGELGGQLGIAEESLVEFAETIAAVGVATNLTTEEAAVGFAQLANIMGTPQDQISNMASTVVALGNNFATTERDVFNFAQRIAGAGQIAGLTEAQVFAIGAAMSSVGVQAEAGGTAVQKVLIAMNEAALGTAGGLETFAATAGVSADEFAAAWEEDAGQAFNMFVQGLGEAGDDAIGILDDLDLKDQRLIRSFLSLAGAGDLLEEAMNEANIAFEENAALANEASKRYATTESKIAILKNTIKDIAITIGLALLPAFNAVLDVATRAAAWLGDKLATALNKVLIPAIEDAIDVLEDLYDVFKSDILPLISRRVQKAIGGLEIVLYRLGQAFGYAFAGDVAGVMETVWSAMYEGLGISDELSIKISDTAGAIVEWFSIAIPNAILTFSQSWQTNVTPIIDSLAVIIFDRLIPAFSVLWSWLSEIIPQALDALSPMVDVLQQVFMTLAGQIAGPLVLAFMLLRGDFDEILIPVLQFLADFIENTVIPAVADLANFISQHSDAIVGAIQGIGVALTAAKIAGIIGGIVAAVSSLISPIGLLIAGIALLGAAWADNWFGIRDIVGAVVEWLMVNVPLAINVVVEFFNTVLIPAFQAFVTFIQENVIPVIVDFANFAVAEFQKWVDWANENMPLIKRVIEKNLEGIKIIVGAVLLAIYEFWQRYGDDIITVATSIYNNIKTFISGAMDVIRGIITTVLQLMDSDWSGAWETIQNTFQTALDTINTIAENTLATLKDTIIPAALDGAKIAMETAWNDVVVPAFQALIEALPGILETVWNDLVKPAFQAAIEALPGVMAIGWELVKTALSELIDALPGIIETAWGAVKAEVRRQIEFTRNALETAWNDLVKPAFQAAIDELPGIVEGIGEALKTAGENIINMLKEGLSNALEGVKDWFGNQLQQLTDMLPGSEPKDRSSPLYGLSKSGEAIINNLMDGVAMAAPDAVRKFADIGSSMGDALVDAVVSGLEEGGSVIENLLDVAGGLGSIGGGLARIFERQQIDPLADQIDDIDAELEALRERDASDMYEQMWIADRINTLEAERLGLQEQMAAEQERLLRLQEQQQQLDLLRQQQDLINLIAEYGLDPSEILGGFEFGLDADLGMLLDAMTRAMQQIIAAAEDELGIASPSKVFEQIGAFTGEGFAIGFADSMNAAMRNIQFAASSIAMPSFASPTTTQNQYIDNSRSVSVAVGGTPDERPAQLQQATCIKRVVLNGLEGIA